MKHVGMPPSCWCFIWSSNKELIAQWAQDRGEDSDCFRVRVLGLPPPTIAETVWGSSRHGQRPPGHPESFVVCLLGELL